MSGDLPLREVEEKAHAAIIECHNCRMGFRSDLMDYVDDEPYCLDISGKGQTLLLSEERVAILERLLKAFQEGKIRIDP